MTNRTQEQLKKAVRIKIRSFGLVSDEFDDSGGFASPILSRWPVASLQRVLDRMNALPSKITGQQLNSALYDK